MLQSKAGHSAYAIVIGVDDYKNALPLKGAVADAKDIAATMRQGGVQNPQLLIDDQVSRKSVIDAFDGLLAQVASGDVVYLTIAGYGGTGEPGDNKAGTGSKPVFLLPKFDPQKGDTDSERLAGADFQRFIEAVERAGGRVVFVADMSLGYGMARGVDQRSSDLTFRSVRLKGSKAAATEESPGTQSFIGTDAIK
ncbi:MAG TPA: caspase family protein, partial [Beijerinckiaceae bacterium]|nr:caspase family protein [Beijerinckiaceae bacterium]